MNVYGYRLEIAIEKYMLGRKYKSFLPDCVRAVVDALYWDDIAKIAEGICPYCGKRFKRRIGVIMHLKLTGSRMSRHGSVYTNPCYIAFQRAVVNAEEMYYKIRPMVKRMHGDVYLCLPDGKRKYSNMYEACMDAVKYVLQNEG